MKPELRRSGIDVIGDVPWGTHFCEFYATSQDLIETLVPYFKEGLDANEFCMWVTSEPLQVDQAKAALLAAVPNLNGYINKGQIEILDYSQWYKRSGKFSADEVLQGWVDKLKAAQKRGFEGLRLTGNTFWLEKTDWDDFTRYEETVNSVIGRYPMLALCTYSLQKCNALEILDVIVNHQFALIKRLGRWEVIESAQHKEMEQALRESEERYHSFIANSSEGIYRIESDQSMPISLNEDDQVKFILEHSYIAECNDAFALFHGFNKAEELIGKKLSDVLASDPRNIEAIRSFIRSGYRLLDLESHEIDKDGNKHIISNSLTGVVNNGFLVRGWGVQRDLTGRKQAEEALRESVEKYRRIVETANEGIWTTDAERKTVFVNQRMADMLGYTIDEMIGRTASNFLSEDQEPLAIKTREDLKSGLKTQREFSFYRKDGSKLWAISNASPIFDAEGHHQWTISMLTDITERKKGEERLHITLESIADGFFSCDADWRFVYVNAPAERILGIRREEVIGKSHWDVFPLTLGTNLEREYRRVAAGEIRDFENFYEPWGRWFHNRCYPREDGGMSVYFQDITEQKKAAEDLRRKQIEIQVLFDNTPAGLVLFDAKPPYMVLVHNRYYQELFAEPFRTQGMVGLNVYEYAPEVEAEGVVAVFDEVVRTKQPKSFLDFPYKSKPPKESWYNWHMAPIIIDNQVVALVSMSIDVTDRHNAEKALQESEQRFVTTLASIGDAIIATDIEGKVTFMNAVAEELTGWNFNEALQEPARKVFNIVNEQTRQQVDDPVTKVLEIGAIVGLANHTLLIRKDGTEIAIDDSGAPIRNPSGGITGTVLVFRDITERRRAENELREKTDYLENLIGYANAPIIVWDSNFKITRFNYAFERLTGFKATGILGKPLDLLFPEDSKEESLAHIRRTLSGERWETVEIPIRRIDGSVRTVLWNSANILDKDNSTIIATIAQGQDITDQKIAENMLKKSRDELELRVRERTADLLKAKEAAEAAAASKAAFLANMSHELRTPLNSVIGYSSLLTDESLSQEQKDYIEGIRIGGEALLEVLSDILEFSKAEKENIELEYQPFSLKHCIDEALDLIAVQAVEKGLNLASTIKHGTPDTIIGDNGRVRQVLTNLLNNAVKFTDSGDISVSVSSRSIGGTKREILFEVKDSGIGIPKDKIAEIFEPFTQVEMTLSRQRGGVGLGLAISKRLVELMGGTIMAESVPGNGTIFRFTIQAETIAKSQLESGKSEKVGKFKKIPTQKRLRILVAEDNPSNRRVLVEMLKRMGYRAETVADGKEAVQSLERQDYDLILMDIKMPEMDGITAAKVIRQLKPSNGPKIIAITAFALEGDREKCLEAGMDGYLAKPVKLQDLVQVLDNI